MATLTDRQAAITLRYKVPPISDLCHGAAMTDAPFEATFTREFRRSLPDGCRRLLEIGAGAGELASLLMRDGFQVLALDLDPDAVAVARERGVDARAVQWPAALDERFDAVLFTRSLHHIRPLDESVVAAAACLTPGGRVVVEDFDFESVDQRTLAWFTKTIRLLREGEVLSGGHELLDDLLSTEDLLAAWRRHHDHDLHRVEAMEAALRRGLTDVTVERAPYLFRYLGAALGSSPGRNPLVRVLAYKESRLIADGTIEALGWRLRGAVGLSKPG